MFDNVKKNFGFGCMRLPMKDGEVDTAQFSAMVDRFIEAGFNYFDTAHGYIDGKSEKAVRTCLTSRYPRDAYVLANKLSGWFFEKEEQIVPLYFEIKSMIDQDVLDSALNAENATFNQYDSIFKEYTSEISSTMHQAYKDMKKYHLYNIGSSEGMQAAGFTTYLTSYGMPYIYLYTYGDLGDISSFVHEFGHFFSYYYNGTESDNIIDVAEIQSQANEWLFMPYYDLTEKQLDQYTLHSLSESLLTIIQGCLFDEFQQIVYRDNITKDYKTLFESLAKDYGLDKVITSEVLPNYWALVHHNFVMPMYYISYAVSALPALEIFFISQENREEAIDSYLDVIDETGFNEYLDVLDDADLSSPFKERTYERLSKDIKDFLKATSVPPNTWA